MPSCYNEEEKQQQHSFEIECQFKNISSLEFDSFYSCLTQWLDQHALYFSQQSQAKNFFARIQAKNSESPLNDTDVINIKRYFDYLNVLDCYDVSPIEYHH